MADCNALFLLRDHAYRDVYDSPKILEAIHECVHVLDAPHTPESIADRPDLLAQADVILGSWGTPRMDEAFLAQAPRLRAVFYGAGSVRGVVTDAFWERGLRIASAVSANAVPVAEFTLSQIHFCLKLGWQNASREGSGNLTGPGGYGRTVGLISLGNIARLVRRYLRQHDLEVAVFDPFLTDDAAAELEITRCTLDEIFQTSDVVSLHTPDLPETRGMIRGEHFAAMRPNASFINTARSAVVRHGEMIDIFRERTDLWAVLDVTETATPAEKAALRELPNVTLTPHIAGSMGRECLRMGQYMVDDLRRYLAGEPLKCELTREQAAVMA